VWLKDHTVEKSNAHWSSSPAFLIKFSAPDSSKEMIMSRVALVAAVSAIFAGLMFGAQAADLGFPPVQAPAAVAPTPFNWTGWYVGVNGGGAWGRQDPFNIITDRFDPLSTSISGGLVGGTLGAQAQAGSVLLGIEADIDWAHITGTTTVTPTVGGGSSGSGHRVDQHRYPEYVKASGRTAAQ
jgi:opacity protein-like surface antigen